MITLDANRSLAATVSNVLDELLPCNIRTPATQSVAA
jgi:hypothetical protein